MRTLKFLFHRLLALWLIACAAIGYAWPAPFLPLRDWTLWLIAAVIFFMGLTLEWEQVGDVLRSPRRLLGGLAAKWLIVPLFAYAAAIVAFRAQPQLAAGTILDGATPSGVSANVFTFLSGGSVALSVAMSALNMLVSPLLTPLATSRLAGTFVAVDTRAMFAQMIEIVLVPVLLGLTLRALFRAHIQRVQEVLPLVSAAALCLIVLALIAASAGAIHSQLGVLPRVVLVTTIQIGGTLALGYLVGFPLRLDRADRIAVMFEVGIYNSGLGAALAGRAFGPFAALPAIANAMANLIIGSMLAAYLAYRAAARLEDEARRSACPVE